jgi:response regulator RpfG family c-di-GMP phosphodiesterase
MNQEILLIEDEEAHSTLVRRAFDASGMHYELVVVETLAAAREWLLTKTPVLIIADWKLPDGEGLELLKESNPVTSIPIILMTSHGNEKVAVDAMKAGALDYIVKTDQALAEMAHIAHRGLREWEHMLKRQQAETELQKRINELETVNRVSALMRSLDSLEAILPRFLDETMNILAINDVAIWLFKPDTENLELALARGSFKNSSAKSLNPNESILGTIFQNGQPYLCIPSQDPNLIEELKLDFKEGWEGVFLPIRTANQTLGVLVLAVEPSRKPSVSQVQFLTTLCEIAGSALYRMRLYELTKHNLDRISALRTIDLSISASVDFHPTLEIILNQSLTQLQADAAAILKLNRYTNQLEVEAWQGFNFPPNIQTHVNLSDSYSGKAILERHLISIPDLSKVDHLTRSATLGTGDLFSAYHAIPLIAKGVVKGVFEVFHRRRFHPDRGWLDFLEALASQAAISIDNIELFEELQRSNQELRLSYDATIEGWSYALDLRDRETEGHTRRLVEMTIQLGRRVEINEDELIHIRRGALLHDIGKMGVPDNILFKPGSLSDEEWQVMRMHPVYAYEMLSSVSYLRKALEIPYCHHEFWNGEGYPRGLRGEDIPIKARIFSLADVWDALNSDRPYRPAWPKSKVIGYMKDMAGVQFDPTLVPEFFNLIESIEISK